MGVSTKQFLRGFYHSFPVQLVFLHIRKFQVLLIFWYVLASTLNGSFMKSFGADSLFLAPEYLGKVNAVSTGIVGASIAVFIMSWNITTFILFSRHFRFLATTSNPFLKYCINNCIIPVGFLIFYFVKAFYFASDKELMMTGDFMLLVAGFICGLALIVAISFIYFFRADRTIIRRLTPVISNPRLFKAQFKQNQGRLGESGLINVEWYLNSLFTIRKVRDVSHYSLSFLETVFSRHHFAAVLSIFVSFVSLILVGFWLDNPLFQLPAASGIIIFFAILIAVSGAFSYFMQSWSIPFFIGVFVVMNFLYRKEIIDLSNKAYGLNYANKSERPQYNRETLHELSSPAQVERDRQNMIGILNAWKAKQKESKPLLVLISTSGGGNRSATFTVNVLQRLDSVSHGELMRRTFLITGSSGGMLGAAYFRQLWYEKARGQAINLQDRKYPENISGDLLNPIFTSFVARDLASPAQKFKVGNYEYIKDRGYFFEQKLNANTGGILNKTLRDFYEPEKHADMPLMIISSVITRDGRKLLIGTQPMSFLMRPKSDSAHFSAVEPDALDYEGFFVKQDPLNLRMLTALRMNATFPYVLPNVWLPTTPVIDVMDAGLRDNFGQENVIRFVQYFEDWIKENTRGVLMLQVRDRKTGGWEWPYEATNITEIITKPMLLLEYNWYKIQEYNQNDLLSLSQGMVNNQFHRLAFQYLPKKENEGAALNFHLTKSEKIDIAGALESEGNQHSFDQFIELLQAGDSMPKKAAIAEKHSLPRAH